MGAITTPDIMAASIARNEKPAGVSACGFVWVVLTVSKLYVEPCRTSRV